MTRLANMKLNRSIRVFARCLVPSCAALVIASLGLGCSAYGDASDVMSLSPQAGFFDLFRRLFNLRRGFVDNGQGFLVDLGRSPAGHRTHVPRPLGRGRLFLSPIFGRGWPTLSAALGRGWLPPSAALRSHPSAV